ncbi:MAG: hypothetical protein JNL39_02715 [Opitutaceae bacterium]|nr:hypothetical protein [Opitutaceae bacterium]
MSQQKRPSALLGLDLAGGRLRASHVARTKGGLETVKSAAAALTLDLEHPEPELLGREIANHLAAAGIRERHCVVAVPPGWIMAQQTRMPDLAPEDATSLLQLEAEKAFPCDPAELQIARSPQGPAAGGFVTQLAVRRELVDRLATALREAGLRPLGFTLGLAALPGAIAPKGAGRLTLQIEPQGATLLISAGGGIVALRTFEATVASEAGEHLINGPALARELRITHEQVPPELRAELRTLFLTGDDALARQMEETLRPWAREAGLELTRSGAPSQPGSDRIAEQLAARALEGAALPEFMPPRPSRWAQLVARYNSRRLATIGFAAAAAAVIALGVFAWQVYTRWSLRREWEAMQQQATTLEVVQGRIREFRPWYDSAFRNLSIMRRVTECFPDNGSVTAKTFEIHGTGSATVTVTGTARDNAALLATHDELRKTREVQALKIEQIRGKVPAQFTLTFRWNPAAP